MLNPRSVGAGAGRITMIVTTIVEPKNGVVRKRRPESKRDGNTMSIMSAAEMASSSASNRATATEGAPTFASITAAWLTEQSGDASASPLDFCRS
jgi:hypothetical protein